MVGPYDDDRVAALEQAVAALQEALAAERAARIAAEEQLRERVDDLEERFTLHSDALLDARHHWDRMLAELAEAIQTCAGAMFGVGVTLDEQAVVDPAR